MTGHSQQGDLEKPGISGGIDNGRAAVDQFEPTKARAPTLAVTGLIRDVRRGVAGTIGDRLKELPLTPEERQSIIDSLEQHFREFPEEPSEGFADATEYIRYASDINRLLVEERRLFNKHQAAFHLEDPERPGKKLTEVVVACADGRNCPTLCLSSEEILSRFASPWLPQAGLIIFPEIPAPRSMEDLESIYTGDQWPMIKDRLQFMYGSKLQKYFRNKGNLGDVFGRFVMQIQSHFCASDDSHGCGAHGSDFGLAQLEAVKNCFLIDKWLQETYPDHYERGDLKVYHTTHDTRKGGHIYSGASQNYRIRNNEIKNTYGEVFSKAQERFTPPDTDKDMPDVYRKYVSNHYGIDTEKHGEQAIRVSNKHYAHTLLGQSVLEISWTNNPVNLKAIIKKLLGIIEANFRKSNPNKPAILHLDLLKGRDDMTEVYKELMLLLLNDQEIGARIQSRLLIIVTSFTDPDSYQTEFSKQ